MSLLEILGNYYDSASEQFTKVTEEVNFTVQFTMKNFTREAVRYKIEGIASDNRYQLSNSYGDTNLFELCNKIAPSFYMNDKVGRSAINANSDADYESFNITAQFESGAKLALRTREPFGHESMVRKYFEDKDSIPKNFTIVFNVKRTGNVAFRRLITKEVCNGKTPKEYFAQICDASFDNSRGTPTSKYRVRQAFKHRTIKYNIINHYRKEEGIFLAEYLYGVKVPKSATYQEFFKRLANRPQTDFGIKDVQVLKKVVYITRRGIDPVRTTQQFLELGLKPSTDLKRWYNKSPGLEKIIAGS